MIKYIINNRFNTVLREVLLLVVFILYGLSIMLFFKKILTALCICSSLCLTFYFIWPLYGNLDIFFDQVIEYVIWFFKKIYFYIGSTIFHELVVFTWELEWFIWWQIVMFMKEFLSMSLFLFLETHTSFIKICRLMYLIFFSILILCKLIFFCWFILINPNLLFFFLFFFIHACFSLNWLYWSRLFAYVL